MDFLFKHTFIHKSSWNAITILLIIFFFGFVTNQAYHLEENIVAEVCSLQCQALCYSIGSGACEPICGSSGQKQTIHANAEWQIHCTREHTRRQTADCVGSCSTIPRPTDPGYVPEKPRVRAIHEASSGHITLSWNRDPQSVNMTTLYIVLQKDGQSWNFLGWVSSEHFQVARGETCKRPQFKVAAVSRYGSRWFSDAVSPPTMQPGPPTHGTITSLVYNNTSSRDDKNIHFTLQWLPPTGWPSEDILQYPVYTDPLCFSLDPPRVFIRSINTTPVDTNTDLTTLTGTIPVRGIGCNVTVYIHAVSRCDSNLQSPALVLTLDLGCHNFPNYTACTAPPTIYPGPVRAVELTVIPYSHVMIGLVSWQPPKDLGTEGRLQGYHLTWGIVDFKDTNVIFLFKSVLGNTTVSGFQHSADITINQSSPLSESQTIGIKIIAVAPRQQIDETMGVITIASNILTRDTPRLGVTSLRTAQTDGSWRGKLVARVL